MNATTNDKQPNDLQSLADMLQKQQTEKRDFVAPASSIKWHESGLISIEGTDEHLAEMLESTGVERATTGLDLFGPNIHFCKQIASKLDIPNDYFFRMMSEQPKLLAENVNTWLQVDERNFMVRTFMGQQNVARAFLSDRFKAIDNVDVLFTVLKAIKESGANVEVKECRLSDENMFVKVVSPDIGLDLDELKRTGIVPDLGRGHRFLKKDEGAWMSTGFIFGNSEVGGGTFFISPLGHILACTNYLIQKDAEIKRIHLGEKLEAGMVQWSEATRNSAIELVMNQSKDAIRTFLSPDFVGQLGKKILAAQNIIIENPVKAVEELAKRMRFSNSEQEDILSTFIKDKDFSLFGLSNAVTFQAHQEGKTAERQVEMEELGVEILDQRGMGILAHN